MPRVFVIPEIYDISHPPDRLPQLPLGVFCTVPLPWVVTGPVIEPPITSVPCVTTVEGRLLAQFRFTVPPTMVRFPEPVTGPLKVTVPVVDIVVLDSSLMGRFVMNPSGYAITPFAPIVGVRNADDPLERLLSCRPRYPLLALYRMLNAFNTSRPVFTRVV